MYGENPEYDKIVVIPGELVTSLGAIKESIELHATWEKLVKITFDLDGGNILYDDREVVYKRASEEYKFPEEDRVKKYGYRFSGWKIKGEDEYISSYGAAYQY